MSIKDPNLNASQCIHRNEVESSKKSDRSHLTLFSGEFYTAINDRFVARSHSGGYCEPSQRANTTPNIHRAFIGGGTPDAVFRKLVWSSPAHLLGVLMFLRPH